MRTVEVRSNIAGDIMKIRKGVVFKEHATVIDELLQNCQRAKATQIDVVCEDDRLVIKDNGTGCKDPQDLFEKNTSAWSNEDEAFGEGFFSVFLVADKIKVRSADWELTVDILDMLKTKNMNIEVTEELEFVEGFSVELEGKGIDDNGWSLRGEVRKLGAILPMPVTLNGSEVETKPLMSLQNSKEQFIETDLFTAVLQPATGWSGVEYFYENRPIRCDYVTGLTGRVAIKKGCITLKAPDRKEFIYDDKRIALVNAMEDAAKKIYREFIAVATDDELDMFEEPIQHYLDVEEYAEILNVSSKLFQNSLAKAMMEEASEQTGQKQNGNIPKWVQKSVGGIPAAGEGQDEEREERKQRRSTGLLKTLVEREKKLVYVSQKKVEEFEAQIKEAEYNGFVIAYAKNRLYEKAFEFYGIPSIAELKALFVEDILVENDYAKSRKEERLLFLLKRVEKHYGMADGSIKLANLRRETRHKLTGEVLSNNKDEVHGMCSPANGTIYIDRKIVRFPEYRAQDPEYPTVTAHDYKVLLRINQTLCHELAHLLYGYADNTLEHSQAMIRIGYDLAELF